ncbi:DUF4249 family protein [Candidatus Amoebophilus asiaticus]|nr:DUF4249 family protein [Candidatus Amoebophilus asiaticus]
MSLRRNIYLLILIIFLFSVYTCKTDLELLADWKETTVVYGLLNPADSVHYIKINKAFLGEGDAYEMALVYDSLYHKGSLVVKLIEYENGINKTEIILEVDSSISKESGTFSYPNQMLYMTPGTNILNSTSSYKLEIKKVKTGEVIASSETDLVNDFVVLEPRTDTSTSVAWAVGNAYSTYTAKWNSAKNGKLYELIIIFHYMEFDKTTGDTVTSDGIINWPVFSRIKSSTTDGGEFMTYEVNGKNFYTKVKSYFGTSYANVNRKAGKLDFVFSVGGNELNTYIDVNNAQSGLVQSQVKPEYTNIDGGLGIFSSRFTKMVKGKSMTRFSIDSLACGEITKHLNFYREDSSLPCN